MSVENRNQSKKADRNLMLVAGGIALATGLMTLKGNDMWANPPQEPIYLEEKNLRDQISEIDKQLTISDHPFQNAVLREKSIILSRQWRDSLDRISQTEGPVLTFTRTYSKSLWPILNLVFSVGTLFLYSVYKKPPKEEVISGNIVSPTNIPA